MKKLIIGLAITLATQSTFAIQQFGQERGGGSGLAAEIARATSDFINIVRNNRSQFPGVNPYLLERLHTEYVIVNATIRNCETNGELDAYTDKSTGKTTFNRKRWVEKTWQEKVHLAGHERLVLAGLEESNQYNLSNMVFLTDDLGKIKNKSQVSSVCEFGKHVCVRTKDIENNLSELFKFYEDGDFSSSDFAHYTDSYKGVVESELLIAIGLKAIELEKSFFTSKKEQKLADYRRKLELALNYNFMPYWNKASRMRINNGPTPVKCVEIK